MQQSDKVMSTIINGIPQNQVAELNSLNKNLYENIFNVNLINNDTSDAYFYNLLNKVILPEDISDEYVERKVLTGDKPWTMLSFELYGTIQLWWTIVLLNKPINIFKAEANTEYKYIKPELINSVLQQITVSSE